MIRVFGQTDTSFVSNGDVVLSPLKAKVTKKDNGDYYLDLETGLEYSDFFVEGNIVVANTPTGDQAFRIDNVTKTKSKLVTKCWHVFYDSKNYLIADSYVEDKDCDDALDHLNSATEPESEFTTISDVETVNSYRCVRESLYRAIQKVLERWGGHLVRDNFDIAIRENIGTDNGIIVQYKKNLRDITCQEVWDAVVTKLLPVGKDGIILNELDPTADIYVESDLQYDIPYCKTVTFTQDDILEEDYETEQAYKEALVADLYAQAVDYVEKNSVPQVNYTLKANLEKVTDIGDTVEVIDDRLGIHMMTNVIGFVYDCISEQYTEVEFGTFARTLSGIVNTINQNTEKIASETVQNFSDVVMGIMTKSYVIYDGDQILIVDALPKEVAQNVIIIDSSGIGFSQNGISGQITSQWNIDGSLMLNEDTVTDFVKSEGTTSGWSWKIYASGEAEAHTQIEVNSSSVTWTSVGSFSKGDIPITVPSNITVDEVFAQVVSCGSDVGWASMAGQSSVTILRSGSGGMIVVNILVKGKESP